MTENKTKKTYAKPSMEVIPMATGELLAGSNGHGNGHGHETACEHGSHAWFCDED